MKTLITSVLAGLFCSLIVSSSHGAAFDAFLKVEGVTGESKNESHPDEIELVGFKNGVSLSGVSGAAGGAAVGKPVFTPLRVFKYIDKATPLLLIHCALGKRIPKVTLTLSSPNLGLVAGAAAPAYAPGDFFKIVLSDVLISSINDGTDTTDSSGNLLETVIFDYARVEWTYTPVNSNGSPGTPITRGWDVKASKPFTSVR